MKRFMPLIGLALIIVIVAVAATMEYQPAMHEFALMLIGLVVCAVGLAPFACLAYSLFQHYKLQPQQEQEAP